MTEEHLDGVERLQHECYPTMEEHEKITAERAAHFLEVFREGQTVAVETSGSGRGRVVGMNSGFLVADFDFAKEGGHTFQEITGGLTYSNHSPDGEFYYGYGEGSPKPKLQPRVRLTLSLSLSLSFSLSLSLSHSFYQVMNTHEEIPHKIPPINVKQELRICYERECVSQSSKRSLRNTVNA